MNITSQCAPIAITILLCLGNAASVSAADQPQVAATSCKPLSSVQKRIVDKADHGIDELRNFVWMTHLIYGIGMLDVAESLDGWRAAASCGKQVADAASKQE